MGSIRQFRERHRTGWGVTAVTLRASTLLLAASAGTLATAVLATIGESLN